MTASPNDMELIAAFRQGEGFAVRQLYDWHYRALCYYAERLINNKQEAQDIALDGFVKLLHKKEDFATLSDIKSFLFTATRNACFDYHRASKRHQNSHLEIKYLADQTDAANDLAGINAEVMQALYQEIEKLPAQCREVFKLYFFKGYSTEEVAHQLNIASKTALNQKAKAVQLLRAALLQKGMLSTILLLQFLAMSSQRN